MVNYANYAKISRRYLPTYQLKPESNFMYQKIVDAFLFVTNDSA